jgi:hypothetical protein
LCALIFGRELTLFCPLLVLFGTAVLSETNCLFVMKLA